MKNIVCLSDIEDIATFVALWRGAEGRGYSFFEVYTVCGINARPGSEGVYAF